MSALKRNTWLGWLLAAIAVCSLPLLACGDDDDDNEANGGGNASDNAGQDDQQDAADGSGQAPGDDDERYVGQLCAAVRDLTGAITELSAEDLADVQRQFDALEEPIRAFVGAVEEADPPEDGEEYHRQALEPMRAYLEAVEERDQEAILELDAISFPEPPAELRAR